MAQGLPSDFEDLSSVLDWDLDTMAERRDRRMGSTMDELQAFYDTMVPRMDAVLEYLAGVSMTEDMAAGDVTLLNLTKSVAEIAPAVEQFFEPTVSYGYEMDRFTPGPE